MAPPVNEQHTSNTVTGRQAKTDLTSVKADASIQHLRDKARTETTREAVKTIQNTQTRTHAPAKHVAHHAKSHLHDRDSDSESERREQRSIADANRRSNRASSSRATGKVAAGTAGQALDPEALERNEKIGELLVNNNASLESRSVNAGAPLEETGASHQSRDAQTAPATTGVATQPEASIKLLELVGPQATLTFQEKLREVWVKLDESAVKQLDVIARLPANLQGQTSRELLMVESPQGVHFVAFLKNKNDFEILSSFDRRAMLPESPSRQLVEAGIHAYEQLDTVARGTGEKLEQKVRERAVGQDGHNDVVLNELRKLCIQEKRRRSTFRRMVDYLVDRLDELDLIDQQQDRPAVGVEEKMAESFGSEMKDQFDISDMGSAVADNRPTTSAPVVFDDGDGESEVDDSEADDNVADDSVADENSVDNNAATFENLDFSDAEENITDENTEDDSEEEYKQEEIKVRVELKNFNSPKPAVKTTTSSSMALSAMGFADD